MNFVVSLSEKNPTNMDSVDILVVEALKLD